MNATPRARNPQAVLRLTAIHLANEQLAILEGFAADNNPKPDGVDFLGKVDDESDDLTTNNFGKDNPIKFKVETARKDLEQEKLLMYTVTVSWKVNGKDDSVTLERTVRVGEKVQAEENS